MMLKLGTIEQEAAACRERWKGYDTGTLAAHAHHEIPFEVLTQPSETRIAYILSKKPENERALRLRCFAPVDLTKFPELRKATAEWEQIAAAWLKAGATSREMTAAWLNADAALSEAKTKTEREQAYGAWKQAGAKWRKTDAELQKVKAQLESAEAKLRKIPATAPHAEICPLGSDCPWDGKTIFRIGRKEK
jgi:multidrug resistance efflux pump